MIKDVHKAVITHLFVYFVVHFQHHVVCYVFFKLADYIIAIAKASSPLRTAANTKVLLFFGKIM